MRTGPVPPHGPGLHAQRTRLAWRRTTLAASVTALVAVGRVVRGGATPLAVAGILLIVAGWVGVLLVANRRIRTLPAGRSPVPPAGRAAAAAGVVTACLALLSVLLLG